MPTSINGYANSKNKCDKHGKARTNEKMSDLWQTMLGKTVYGMFQKRYKCNADEKLRPETKTPGAPVKKQWQDYVISIVSFSFGFMLLPMMYDAINGYDVNLISSGLTMVGIYVLAYTFWTLDLKKSFISQAFTGTVWLAIFILGIT